LIINNNAIRQAVSAGPNPSRGSRVLSTLALAVLLAGCTVVPSRIDEGERGLNASRSLEQLFARQEPVTQPLTLYEATARAIRYQQEYRTRLMEEAAALGQLDVAQFDLLPKITVNAGYSTRNNEAFGFGFTPGGTIAANPSASSERQHVTNSIGFAWNILDFGASYYRAKQLADQSLIVEERRRKALQNLVQDVRLAWWRAEAAQRLLPMIDVFFEELEETIERTRVIESRKLLPPLQTASLRRALLDMQQQIALRRQELAQAQIELAALVNAPPGSQVKIAPPRVAQAAKLDISTAVDALEGAALRQRPEMAEELYKARINEFEARKALLALFPGLGIDISRNYDSNRFLVNNAWYTGALNIAFNLARAFSMPAVQRSAEAQQKVDEARRLAMTMTVLTQTRMAAVRYALMSEEFDVWHEAARDDEQIVQFLASSSQVGIDSEIELIRARARFIVSKINRDLLYANLEGALGRIYNSVGMDVLPDQVASHELGDLARQLQQNIERWQAETFTPQRETRLASVALGEIVGVPEGAAVNFRRAVSTILEASKIPVAADKDAALVFSASVVLQPLRDGGRPVIVRVRVVDASDGRERFASEFKTTLSEPVSDIQWTALGEGAGYRVVAPVRRMAAGRPARRAGEVGETKTAFYVGERFAAAETEVPAESSASLALRLETHFDPPPQPRLMITGAEDARAAP